MGDTVSNNMVLGVLPSSSRELWKGLARMFFLVDPEETSFPDISSLPEPYLSQAAPYFFSLIALEWAILLAKGERIRLSIFWVHVHLQQLLHLSFTLGFNTNLGDCRL